MNQHPLFEKAMSLAKTFLSTELELIKTLQEIDKERLYLAWGYNCLSQFVIRGLGLGSYQAFTVVGVSRKCAEVPSLQKAVETGMLNISRAKRILPVIQESNSQEWIQKALELPQKELEKAVAAKNPDMLIPEKLKPVSMNRSEFRTGMSHELEEKIRRAQILVSQAKGRHCSLEEVLEHMTDFFIKAKDPLARAERVTEKKALAARRVEKRPGAVKSDRQNPRYILASIRHAVFLRDRGQCRYKLPDGKACGERKFVDIHHVRPLSEGGATELANLISLCGAHHKRVHFSPIERTERKTG